ncbi:MAG: ribosome biogenesis GTPase Der [Chlamydiales bacterium]|nr:ribosome biogenesis GTPase Der [Chlamydiales bacterium]
MSHLIRVAIVGRPNVGKSALFNAIVGKRIAIVDEAEGVTRDRLYAEADFFGQPFEIIDTGGIDPSSPIPFQEEVRRQAEVAIHEADVIIMVVDGTVGLTEIDDRVARTLLKTKKPICLAVNKVDSHAQLGLIHEFHGLGISKIVPVSAVQRFQIAELLEHAFKDVTFPEEQEDEGFGIKVAIIGRPNVGKSTLLNAFMEEERCVVSPIPGTTRDSIDVHFTFEGRPFTLIDTAGIRRKRAEHDAVDKFAAVRTERAIERADVCILMLDAVTGITTQEKRLLSMLEEAGKGCLLVFNKWDLVKGFRMEHCLKSLEIETSFASHCPTLFISAKSGRNLEKIIPLIEEIAASQKRRVTTGELNRFLEKSIQAYHPPMLKGKRLRIYYLAQVGISPPHFVMFVNSSALMLETYKQYLINQFRKTYGFNGVPLVFTLRGKREREEESTTTLPPKSSLPAAPLDLDLDEELDGDLELEFEEADIL